MVRDRDVELVFVGRNRVLDGIRVLFSHRPPVITELLKFPTNQFGPFCSMFAVVSSSHWRVRHRVLLKSPIMSVAAIVTTFDPSGSLWLGPSGPACSVASVAGPVSKSHAGVISSRVSITSAMAGVAGANMAVTALC